MAKRKKLDWDAIGLEYRAGKMSNYALAEKYSCAESAIRGKAKKLGWVKDLSARIKEEVRTKLVRKKVRTLNATEKQVVAEAAEHDVGIVGRHCETIRHGREIVSRLLCELEAGTLNHSELIGLIDSFDDKKKDDAKRKEFLFKMIGLPERAKTINQLVNALSRLVDLERQAHNIGDDPTDEDPIMALLNEVAKRATPLIKAAETDDE